MPTARCPASSGCLPIKHLLTATAGVRNYAQQNKPVRACCPMRMYAGAGQTPTVVWFGLKTADTYSENWLLQEGFGQG